MTHPDLHTFLEALEREDDLVRVEAEVDPRLEIAEIHRRVIAAGGPALIFTRVKGSSFPVVTNLFGSARRVELAFGPKPRRLVEEAARLPEELLPPSVSALLARRGLILSLIRVGLKRVFRGPVSEVREEAPDLTRLPALTSWPEDGGPFLTLPLVYTEDPGTGRHNLGVYRMQIHDAGHAGLHFQIGKGGGFHLAAAEQAGRPLPVHVFLGGPPALILSAIAPLPENVGELMLASLVVGGKLPVIPHPDSGLPMPAAAEFVLEGVAQPGERRPEGPFGDHYGYYSLRHDYPVFRCRSIHRRPDALFPATVVGKPRQEDFFLGDFLQELLSPLFPVVMPGVLDLWSYGETGYHSLSAAVVRERYKREAMVSAFRILGEGQLSLTKFLLVTDRPRDLKDFSGTLEHILARTDLRTDFFVFPNLSMDTLDYTGPKVNEGSKGLGDPVRELPREFSGDLPAGATKAAVFCGGCLVVEGPPAAEAPDLPGRLAAHEALRTWLLVVLVDDAPRTVRSAANFLWTTFTRFEPAADIHTATERIVGNQRVFEPPVVIDARLRPGFPEELFCDEETAGRVTSRWKEYFPGGMEMGDSDSAHLD
jgi:UbiD family decarboxylase